MRQNLVFIANFSFSNGIIFLCPGAVKYKNPALIGYVKDKVKWVMDD